jgi:hypothetical protein
VVHWNRCVECGQVNPVLMRPPSGRKGWAKAILGGIAFGLLVAVVVAALERTFQVRAWLP